MPAVNLNHITLNYHATGKGGPLVLIHGHPFDHTMWYPQVVDFSDKYEVITPDLRGYGQSTLPHSLSTKFEDYATDILCLMDYLEIDGFHLGGLSMGGQIVMEIYRQAPARVKALILADTFASPDTPEAKQARIDTADKLEKEGMEAYADEVIYKMIMPAHVTSMPEVASHVVKMMKTTSPVAAATALRARAERIDYLNEVLPQIEIPTLVIVGCEDEFTPVVKAEEMQAKLKNCHLAVIEQAGHMPNLEQPEIFNKAVLDFLSSI